MGQAGSLLIDMKKIKNELAFFFSIKIIPEKFNFVFSSEPC